MASVGFGSRVAAAGVAPSASSSSAGRRRPSRVAMAVGATRGKPAPAEEEKSAALRLHCLPEGPRQEARGERRRRGRRRRRLQPRRPLRQERLKNPFEFYVRIYSNAERQLAYTIDVLPSSSSNSLIQTPSLIWRMICVYVATCEV
ncbi:hypothetical protein EE612_021411 [Oryza sativa]|nr:hypothetical protein EE612_021411 [Oryza sativa]